MSMELTNEQKTYLAEIAAQIMATHGKGAASVLAADPVAAVQAAHERRLSFIQEMLNQRTDRSKMARIVLCAGVHSSLRLQKAIEHCGHIADHSWRRANGLA